MSLMREPKDGFSYLDAEAVAVPAEEVDSIEQDREDRSRDSQFPGKCSAAKRLS